MNDFDDDLLVVLADGLDGMSSLDLLPLLVEKRGPRVTTMSLDYALLALESVGMVVQVAEVPRTVGRFRTSPVRWLLTSAGRDVVQGMAGDT
jgi:hypothetical protein